MFDQYTTFHKVINYLELFQTQSPILNTFAYGNLIDFGQQHISGGTVHYPFMFAVPQSIQYDENITTYQFSLIFADILNWDLTNEKDCVSDMSLQARRFLSYIKRGIQTFPQLYDNMDVVLPANAIPFFERFGDHVAGVAMDVQLQVFEDLNACDYYESATPTPSVTVTPTITPTIPLSPEPSMTPTITPSITPSAAAIINLTVASGVTSTDACNGLGTGAQFPVWSYDFGQCAGCVPYTCYACFNTTMMLYSDPSCTIPVGDGYYANDTDGAGSNAVWYIENGFFQGGGFSSC